MEHLAYSIAWIALWVISAIFISRISRSKVVSIGGGFLIAIFALGFIGSFLENKEEQKALQIAQNVGFSTIKEYNKAKALGFNTKSQMDQYENEQKQIESQKQQEQQRQAEVREKEEEAHCNKDLQCLGDKKSLAATIACDNYVENLAKYDFQWTDGFLEPKFSHFRWKDKQNAVITYIGDRIKFQNGFGAWQFHIYECDFDTENDKVVGVRAQPGRLIQ